MHFVHLFHGQLVALFLITERNAQQHLLGVEYVVVIEQRRMKRTFDSLAHTSFTLSESSTHDGHTTVFQHRGHILEVEVYNTMYRNNFGYALGGNGQRIVCLGKGIQHRKLRINLAQAFIIDNQQRIDMLGYFLHPVQCLVYFLQPLKTERYSHDTDRQDTHFLGTGAAPVPVPPPIPAVMKTIRVPSFSISFIPSRLSMAA